MWFCSVERCNIARSVSHQSSRLADFSCRHIDEAKGCKSPSVAILKPNLDNFVCSESLKSSMQTVLSAGACMQNFVIQVSDKMFCVLGQTSASNPLGYCHVRKGTNELNNYVCRLHAGKDCRGFAAKGKQVKTKSMCMHIALLRSCFDTNTIFWIWLEPPLTTRSYLWPWRRIISRTYAGRIYGWFIWRNHQTKFDIEFGWNG
jgi:hypothetical protein